ncbi:hypothetical protein F4604DRAFT_1926912 [Suillus subluteus]|nr:hypothetical protein F4604DRAFT_1926912 [Suillus subluteus]
MLSTPKLIDVTIRQSHKVFVSYHVSFIESHQSGTPVPSLALPAPSSPPSTTHHTSVSIEEIPDIDAPPSSTTQASSSSPDPPRRSSRTSVPSERRCAMDGKPYVSSTQRAVLESLSAADRLRALSPNRPPSENALAAIFTEEEFAALADVFAAMPDNLEHEFPDDPSTYTEAMASEHAAQWTAALKDEFDSLRDLGVYKLVPRSAVPPGRKIMQWPPSV